MFLSRSTMRFAELVSRQDATASLPEDMASQDERSAAVAHARALSLLQQTGINIAVSVAAAAVVIVTIVNHAPAPLVMAWAGMMTLIAGYMGWRHLRGRRMGLAIHHAKRVLGRATWSAALYGIIWGSSAIFLGYLNWQQQIILIIITTGLCAGASSTMAASPRAAVSFMLGIGLPYVAEFVLQFSMPHLLLAVMALLLLIAMSYSSRMAYSALIEGINAQFSARAMAKALENAEQQWRELSETAEAFALYDSYHRLQLWNDAYARLLDLKPQDLERFMGWTRVWQLAGYRRLPEATVLSVDETLAPRLWTEEIALGSKWYRSTVRRLENGHVAVSHVDITALKSRETELLALQSMLEEARDSAEQASTAKSRFLANMSHELRTPLNAVIGFSDLMLHQMRKNTAPSSALTTTHAGYVQTIFDSGHHLLAIVEDMLDLARIEAGKLTYVESDVELVALIRASVELAVGRHVQSLTNIELGLPDGELWMQLDARLTRQALINLIGNALKFTRSRSGKADGKVYLALAVRDNGDIDITVRDEGIGIPAHLIDEVLKPFAQVDGHEARRFGGVGLGLPLAKQFIELQGGSLSLDSVQNFGTTAHMVLPAARVISQETHRHNAAHLFVRAPDAMSRSEAA
jgi:signal transduction histidine kinase